MTCKFNSGRGAHICDRCRVMLCEGTLDHPKRLSYHYTTSGPQHHWMLRKDDPCDGEIQKLRDDNGYDASHPNPWKHDLELCTDCATELLLVSAAELVTAKELYNL